MEEKPNKPEPKRQSDGTFGPGNNANPAGRPKGQTLKEYIRQRFLEMTPEEKDAFIAKLDPIDIFKMAEGNPHTTTDITTDGQPLPTPILPIGYVRSDNGNTEDLSAHEANTSTPGGNVVKQDSVDALIPDSESTSG